MARYLITSALPYINGVKHLGNLVGSMLPADVYARYLRQRGHDVLFICATDEHGAPAELGAAEAKMDVAAYCAKLHEIQADLGRGFGLSFDHFGRSSSPQNHELTHHFAERLKENGYLLEREVVQLYSPADGRYLPDRYVIGTCPHCDFDGARGDQCDNCTRLLDVTDLKNPRSAVSGSTDLEMRPTRHLYFKLSAFGEKLQPWIDSHPEWPLLTSSIAYKWLSEGLEDRPITRDLSWGVSVNVPGFEDKVFYVWFDAPIEYIGATKEWADLDPDNRDWRSWWYDTHDVHSVQFMAKDNVPFHTIMWPAMMMGTGEPWKQADYIKSFSWLTYYGGKFSTSRKHGVFMSDALDVLPADYWRYGLLAMAPETDDSSFTWQGFAQLANKDLAGIFGNFVHRTVSMTARQFDGRVPEGGEPGEDEAQLAREYDETLPLFVSAMEGLNFRNAAFALRTLWTLGNQYLDRTAPWKCDDISRKACILRTALNLARLHAITAHSFVPFASARIAEGFHLTDEEMAWTENSAAVELVRLAPGRQISLDTALFPRIGAEGSIDAWVSEMETRFGGAAQKG